MKRSKLVSQSGGWAIPADLTYASAQEAMDKYSIEKVRRPDRKRMNTSLTCVQEIAHHIKKTVRLAERT